MQMSMILHASQQHTCLSCIVYQKQSPHLMPHNFAEEWALNAQLFEYWWHREKGQTLSLYQPLHYLGTTAHHRNMPALTDVFLLMLL